MHYYLIKIFIGSLIGLLVALRELVTHASPSPRRVGGALTILAPPSPSSRPVWGPPEIAPGTPGPQYPSSSRAGGASSPPKAPEWGGNQSAPRGWASDVKLGAALPGTHPKHLGGEGLQFDGPGRGCSYPSPGLDLGFLCTPPLGCPMPSIQTPPAWPLFPQSEWGALQAGMAGGPEPHLAQLRKALGMPPRTGQSPTPTSTPLGATPLGGLPPLESVAGHTH